MLRSVIPEDSPSSITGQQKLLPQWLLLLIVVIGLNLLPNGEHSAVGMGTCDGWGACGEEQFTNDIGLILNMFGCNFKSGSFTIGV